MRSFNSHFVLIDLNISWQSATRIPASTFAYLRSSRFSTSVSAAFRRTGRGCVRISSSRSSVPSIRSPEIRRPHDRTSQGNGLSSSTLSSPSTSLSQSVSELDLFLELVPLRMRKKLFQHSEIDDMVEVVMDLGRQPLARFPTGDWVISEEPVKLEDLNHAISKVGDFSDDNRSGIDRSLHRISAIRNRKLQIIGLTCRVGRAVSGSAEIIHDLVEGGGSILVIGPPGVGKTTLIREIARMLADEHKKRVVIVDTSNEIGGDGDIPHSGIGRARRMQVPNVNMQHNVMIEAVENHMPETVIIDEIGTELEALAASTIAQRGVQLVATAHGVNIESIVKNPSLQILVGGIESVTLGDDEARKRKVQKTILERKGPPTFSCAVEMVSRTECCVHHRLDATVDAILAGKTPFFEVRRVDVEADGSVKSTSTPSEEQFGDVSELTDDSRKFEIVYNADYSSDSDNFSYTLGRTSSLVHVNARTETNQFDGNKPIYAGRIAEVYARDAEEGYRFQKLNGSRVIKRRSPVYVFTYKILETELQQVAKVMGIEEDIDVAADVGSADVILVSSSELKQNPWIRSVAKFHRLPVFVIKSNTMAQMVKAIRLILGMDSFGPNSSQPLKHSFDIEIRDDAPKRKPSLEEIDALEEVRLAIEYIVIPSGEPVELLPQCSEIVARQLELVESYQLSVENMGTELNPRLQILPQRLKRRSSPKQVKISPSAQKGTGSKASKYR